MKVTEGDSLRKVISCLWNLTDFIVMWINIFVQIGLVLNQSFYCDDTDLENNIFQLNHNQNIQFWIVQLSYIQSHRNWHIHFFFGHRAIFRWMTCKNMYTISFANAPKGSPEEVLESFKNKKGTYARIYETLCGYVETVLAGDLCMFQFLK